MGGRHSGGCGRPSRRAELYCTPAQRSPRALPGWDDVLSERSCVRCLFNLPTPTYSLRSPLARLLPTYGHRPNGPRACDLPTYP